MNERELFDAIAEALEFGLMEYRLKITRIEDDVIFIEDGIDCWAVVISKAEELH